MDSARRSTLRTVDTIADFLRVLSLVGLVLAGILYSWSTALVFIVVAAVMLVPRIAALPRPIDLAVGATWLLAGWANVAGWYLTVPWIDIPIHVVTPGATAAAIYLLLVRVSLVPPLQQRQVRSLALVVLTFALGAALAVLWEFYEWFRYAGPQSPFVGYSDTIGDLFNGCLGSVIAGVGLAVWAWRGWGTRRIPLGSPHRASAS
ncbi:hypothetical protein DFQ14_102412 [Halopolyspora algeriensis]|uniref:DUF2238 domain-containing protein n=1 Tax=Halopolyspora algeriensis TaxID=1500506 RepID=A0A368VXM4_9ACTN|nr:hypothetical protein [Halopolyspora algeriensis]RCW46110.1 hypothetical protein DFQ14_102412 [Halopolyspora algeriensis]TQM55513.1 hypothetical protein FHU43_0287 [Halopolyspora algeriensis]